ncbi:MAG TPA: xanthine dehydrogenase family protein molybdopterin-binding subunit [Chloroflexota bacterium]|nr:xanthine dehydrogenase family protein molybdopterin-binding subunit [Chloroflexota bacterium]
MATESVIGQWVRREDGERKVLGRAVYAGDLRVPNLLHARLVLSPYPHATITRVDTEAAKAVPGVVGVYTAEDLPLVPPDGLTRSRDPLARDRVFFEGQPVVAVVAESEAIAEDAAGLVEIDYEPREALSDPVAAMENTHVQVHDSEALGLRDDAGAHTSVSEHTQQLPMPPNGTTAERYQRGDIDRGFAEADAVVEHTYNTSWVYQGYLEPFSVVAIPDNAGNIDVHSSTQGAFFVREEVAKGLGISERRVNVRTAEVGGAFGAKYAVFDPLVAALAWDTKRPVHLTLTRTEDFLAGVPAPGITMRVKTGARKDGTLTALQATIIVDTGSFPGGTAGIVALLLGGTYRFPHMRIDAYEILTNKPGCGAYRAPGAPQACFAIEGQIEELARTFGLDPFEMRLKNAVVEGDSMPGEETWPRIGSREVLEALRNHPAWQNRHQKGPGEGVGIAFGGWPGGTQPASALCRLNDDGTLTVVVGSSDISGTRSGFALLAADAFGVGYDAVEVADAPTDTAPFAGAAGGSKITFTVGSAVRQAAEEARRQVLAIAADELEAAPDDLEIVDGQVRVKGVPSSAVSLERIAALTTGFGSKHGPILGSGRAAPDDAAPGFIAHLARVRVDDETGKVEVLDYVAVQDVGRAINPAGIVGQIRGGVAQGVGWALLESVVYDESAHLRTSSFMDYALPSALEVPQIDPVLVEVPYPSGPLGGRGVGEPPVVGGAAAIANAIYDATGIRPTDLPMTPERVLQALSQRSS